MIDWPIGSSDERVIATTALPGKWVNSNPFDNYYEIAPKVWNYHDGVDLNDNSPVWNLDYLSPIYAIADGVVTFAGIGGGSWGHIIDIKHIDTDGQFFVSRFGHVANPIVRTGDIVKMGQQVAQVGDADGYYHISGAHLHWNISKPGSDIMLNSPNQWCGTNNALLLSNYTDPIAFVIQRKTLPITTTPAMLDGIIDISHWNPILPVEEPALKADGVVLALIKAGQGLGTDPTYAQSLKVARDIGALTAGYWFGNAGNPLAQADACMSVVDAQTVIALDLEAGMSALEAEIFAQRVYDKRGTYIIIYTRESYFDPLPHSSPSILEKCPLWIASYRDTPILPDLWKGKWTLWQYSNGVSGPGPYNLPGIPGRFDRSRFQGSLDDLKALWKSLTTPIFHQYVDRWVFADVLRVRAKPTTTADIIDKLKFGTKITVDLNQKTGVFVPMAGRAGYVSTDWLQDTVPTPTSTPVTPVAPVTVPRQGSVFGLHIMAQSNNTAIFHLLQTAVQAKKPVAGCTLVKYMWGGEIQVGDILGNSPSTKVVLRHYVPEWDGVGPNWALPDLYNVGTAFMQAYWDRCLKDNPDSRKATWHQIINEPTALLGPGAATWWTGALDVAEKLGLKLAVGAFASGNPRLPDEKGSNWSAMYDMLRRIMKNGHILALHAYIDPDPGGTWNNTWEALRDQMLTHELPGEFADLPIAIIEFGTRFGSQTDTGIIINGLKVAENAFKNDANVEFVSLWTFGGAGAWHESLLDGFIQPLQGYLIGVP